MEETSKNIAPSVGQVLVSWVWLTESLKASSKNTSEHQRDITSSTPELIMCGEYEASNLIPLILMVLSTLYILIKERPHGQILHIYRINQAEHLTPNYCEIFSRIVVRSV